MKAPYGSLILLFGLAGGGCYDFAAPDFPGAGASPVLQLGVLVTEQGVVNVSGILAPGLGEDGFPRRVPHDTLDVFRLRIGPNEVDVDGSRVYGSGGRIAPELAVSQPLELQAPSIEGLSAPPPRISWFAIRRADPDTIFWRRGTDLTLHVDTALGVSVPTPRNRQWFLELRSNVRSFRLSSDGFPPSELRIPSEWVPPTTTSDIITITMAFHQSSRVEPVTGNYEAVFDFVFQVSWVLVVLRT